MRDEAPDHIEADLETLRRLAKLRQQNELWDLHLARNAPARPRPWHTAARENQLAPPGDDWNIWLFLAGRGFGKTRLASEWIAEQAATNPGTEWAIVAPTWRDCRKTCIVGTAKAPGLLGALLPGELESVNLSDLTVRLTNGSVVYGYGAAGEGWQRIRGANLAGAAFGVRSDAHGQRAGERRASD